MTHLYAYVGFVIETNETIGTLLAALGCVRGEWESDARRNARERAKISINLKHETDIKAEDLSIDVQRIDSRDMIAVLESQGYEVEF